MRERDSIPELRDRERLRGRVRDVRDLSDAEIARIWIAIWMEEPPSPVRPVRPVTMTAAYVVLGVLVASAAATLVGFAVALSWLVRAAL